MNRETKMTILAALTATAENPDPHTGICGNVVKHAPSSVSGFTEWVRKKQRAWPRWSGSRTFPVRPTNSDNFYSATSHGRTWDTNTQYGRDRWDLLRFLIMEMLKEV